MEIYILKILNSSILKKFNLALDCLIFLKSLNELEDMTRYGSQLITPESFHLGVSSFMTFFNFFTYLGL